MTRLRRQNPNGIIQNNAGKILRELQRVPRQFSAKRQDFVMVAAHFGRNESRMAANRALIVSCLLHTQSGFCGTAVGLRRQFCSFRLQGHFRLCDDVSSWRGHRQPVAAVQAAADPQSRQNQQQAAPAAQQVAQSDLPPGRANQKQKQRCTHCPCHDRQQDHNADGGRMAIRRAGSLLAGAATPRRGRVCDSGI